MKKIAIRYRKQYRCSSRRPFCTPPRYPLRPYSVRSLRLPSGCLNPAESHRTQVQYGIRPAIFLTKKNNPPHKNHADAHLILVFERRPGTNRLTIYCCVDRCQGADAQRREVAEPRGFRLPAQLHAQPQENRPPIKTVPMPASPKRSGREESRRRILMVCGDNRRREEDVRRRQEVE